MSRKNKELPTSGDTPGSAFRDMDDLARLSPEIREIYDLVGGIEGLERYSKNPNPLVRQGASAVMWAILQDLTRH